MSHSIKGFLSKLFEEYNSRRAFKRFCDMTLDFDAMQSASFFSEEDMEAINEFSLQDFIEKLDQDQIKLAKCILEGDFEGANALKKSGVSMKVNLFTFITGTYKECVARDQSLDLKLSVSMDEAVYNIVSYGHEQSNPGMRAMEWAKKNGHEDVEKYLIQQLIDVGADINVQEREERKSRKPASSKSPSP